MRIVFDAQGALGGSRHRGIGRYTKSFMREFVRAGQEHEILVLLNTMLPEAHDQLRAELADLVPPANFITWSAEPPVGGMHLENWERRAFAREIWEEIIASLEPDLLVISSLFEGAEDDAVSWVSFGRDYLTATICYDLIPMIYRQHYLLHPGMEAFYRRQLEALRRSDFLLAISQSAADEAVQLLRYPKERVINIGAAVDVDFRQVSEIDLLDRFGIDRPFLLYVSAFEVRKNHRSLIEAYASLPTDVRSAHQLVLGGGVGGTGALNTLVREVNLEEDEVVFTGIVDDQELAALYAQSKAVVFPSWHEGFGLPILEAMMFNKAVISSNRSSMPEVVGMADALFDPFDVASIASSIERVLSDDDFRGRLEENAPARVAAFSWERSAKMALEFLEDRTRRYPRPRDYNRRHAAKALERVRSNPKLSKFPADVAAKHLGRSFRREERRQLLIDVSRLVIEDARTGIQRVARAILINLLKSPPEGWCVEPVYASPAEPGYKYAKSFADRILGLKQPWHSDRPVEVWSGDLLCVLDLDPDVLVAQRETLDDWRLHGVQVFTVVHDILPLMLPEYFPPEVGDVVMDRWVRELARHSGAVCVSATVASQLKQWMQANDVSTSPNFRFGWFHHGSDIDNSVPTRGLPAFAERIFSMMKERPVALMVGTLEPRKGHAQALDALEDLWRTGVDIGLIIVGKNGWRTDQLAARIRNHPEFGHHLTWLEGVSDEFLGELYERSSFLLAASEGEGFGLPLIEAARNNLPLIVRDLPVFHEVAQNGALYFPNRRDASAISDTIRHWLDLKDKEGFPQPNRVPRLTWAESAAMLANLLIDGGGQPVGKPVSTSSGPKQLLPCKTEEHNLRSAANAAGRVSPAVEPAGVDQKLL